MVVLKPSCCNWFTFWLYFSEDEYGSMEYEHWDYLDGGEGVFPGVAGANLRGGFACCGGCANPLPSSSWPKCLIGGAPGPFNLCTLRAEIAQFEELLALDIVQ